MGVDSQNPPAAPSAPDGDRAELRDAPPFLDWPRIYLIVLGALAVEIVVFAIVTAAAAR
ncbi:MAG: hypothetical protein QOI66_2580 [Myxococcales bacterium]|jgi:hypothetical protein|nr:hypothetical protein [Myxococcales bacterium]